MALSDLDELQKEIFDLIVEVCRVPGFDPQAVDLTTDLAGPDSYLGLDSLDIVEIVVAVQNKYGVTVGGREDARRIFNNLGKLSQFVRENRTT